MKYKHILFDMDGTLFDFEKAEITAFEKTFIQLGQKELIAKHDLYEEINFSFWKLLEKGRISGAELRIKRFEEFLKSVNCKLDAKIVSEIYIAHLGNGTFLMPNAVEIINYFRLNNIKLSIITNGLKDVQISRIEKSGLKTNFEHIFISEIIGVAKPDKRYFDFVTNILSNKKDELLIVGDSITSDIKGGVDYGIDTVWFNYAKKKNTTRISAKYQIDNLVQLKKVESFSV